MRPEAVFDPMLQHERTALAWERTAIATIVSGTLLARQATLVHPALAVLGIMQVAFGAALIVWTGYRYEALHAPLRRGESPVHPTATRLVGIITIAATGIATLVAIWVSVT